MIKKYETLPDGYKQVKRGQVGRGDLIEFSDRKFQSAQGLINSKISVINRCGGKVFRAIKNKSNNIIQGDSLNVGDYCIIKQNSRHNGRVARLELGGRLVLKSRGPTGIGDYFSNPREIKVKKISEQQALKLIEKYNK